MSQKDNLFDVQNKLPETEQTPHSLLLEMHRAVE